MREITHDSRCSLRNTWAGGSKAAVSGTHVFNNNDLVEIDTLSVRALARVREVSEGGRLHIAFEMGEYLPWVDTDVQIRHFGNDPARSCVARIVHAGSTTAILQLVHVSAHASASAAPMRLPYDTLPIIEEEQGPLESR